jgi:hypothetical protein
MAQQETGGPWDWLSGGKLKALKLGPGAIGNLAVVAVALFAAAALMVWSLRSEPSLAVGALAVVLSVGIYFIERAFRFAEKNPAAALMGGSTYYHYLKDQSAKDKAIIIDNDQIVGAGPAKGIQQIGRPEHE